MQRIRKYPRTQHLEGSRLQPGDEDLDARPIRELVGRYLVIEEKVDGANAAISFDVDGRLLLQSRGHYLEGGHRERHFHLFKTWANRWRNELWDALGARFILYGEWLYAKHTIFYDRLPHYFLEFDVLDTETDEFLSTARRRALLSATPVVPVPVLWEGVGSAAVDLPSLIRHSLYKSPAWRDRLRDEADAGGLRVEQTVLETDASNLAEGLYVKIEESGVVVERYKFIRPSFLTAVLDSGSHWLDRPILPNQLAPGVDIFGVPT